MFPENPLYVIDAEGCQQLFDSDRLKGALTEAFIAAGNPEYYLAEDIALAVEAAMSASARPDRSFTQSEVDSAVVHILENAGFSGVAHSFNRNGSRIYITVDARREEAAKLIERHLGIAGEIGGILAGKVVDALQKLRIDSASPELYLALARHFEQQSVQHIAEFPEPASENAGKFVLTAGEAAESLAGAARRLYEKKIIGLANVSRLYPNFRLSLNMGRLAEELELVPPITELQLILALDRAGEASGGWLRSLKVRLGDRKLPLYLVLTDADTFVTHWMQAEYPAGKSALLELARTFRNALDYPVKKVNCRVSLPAKADEKK